MSTPEPAVKTKSRFQKFRYRYRYQLRPLYVIFWVWLVGGATHEAQVENGSAVRWALIATVVVSGSVLTFTQKWVDRRIERIYAAVCIALAGAWIAAVGEWGVSREWSTRLALVGVLAAIPWWHHFRIRRPVVTDAPQPVVGEDPVAIWEEYVAPEGMALPKSTLTGVRPILDGKGWVGTIILPRGEKATANAIAATDKIRSAFQVAPWALAIEPAPDGNAATAQLMMLHENPLFVPEKFTAPTFDPNTGLARFGRYADGQSAYFRFWMPGSGSIHTLVAGAPGTGKSAFMNWLLAEITHSGGLMTAWVLDPQNGQSVSKWMEHVDLAAAGVDQCIAALESALAIMYDRSTRLAALKQDYFDATVEEPLLMLVIEEASIILQHEDGIRLIGDLAKMARKTGIGITLVVQQPSAKQLGGDSTVREMLQSGNIVVFRTGSSLSGRMAFDGSLPVDPSQIPRQTPDGGTSAGMGYILGPDNRAAMMRAVYVDRPEKWTDLEKMGELEQEAVAAGGAFYRTHRNRRDSEPLAIESHPAVQVGPAPSVTVVEELELDLPIPTPADAVEAVEAALGRLGLAKPQAIAEEARYSLRQTQNALARLVASGRVVKPRRGFYELAAEPASTGDRS